MNVEVKQTSMQEFLKDGTLEIVIYNKSFSTDTVVRRALFRVGEKRYNLIFNNCEHFVSWCKTGNKESKPVRNVVAVGTATTVGTIAAAKGLAARSTIGFAAPVAVVADGVAKTMGLFSTMGLLSIVETGNIIYCDNCGNCTFSLRAYDNCGYHLDGAVDVICPHCGECQHIPEDENISLIACDNCGENFTTGYVSPRWGSEFALMC